MKPPRQRGGETQREKGLESPTHLANLHGGEDLGTEGKVWARARCCFQRISTSEHATGSHLLRIRRGRHFGKGDELASTEFVGGCLKTADP